LSLCKRGNLIKEDRAIAFSQWTDKGYVVCRVTVPMASACGVAPRASPIRPYPLSKTLFIGRTKAAVSLAADSPLAHTSLDPHRSQPL
jgi:hypothetical protein